MPTPMMKTFAKKSGRSLPEVEKMWISVKQSLVDGGTVESDPSFYPKLVGIMKKNLKIDEGVIHEKFKRLLELG